MGMLVDSIKTWCYNKTDKVVGFFTTRRNLFLGEKKQKAGQIRKKEILDAARKVFLSKGFADTVMEDIITETSLSRGGVYYHYKNKVEILHDLMREGMAYRIEKINEFLSSYSGELDGNAVAQMIVDKMLGESELMSVYAIYLQSMKNNEELCSRSCLRNP